jgi:hypothetical protein
MGRRRRSEALGDDRRAENERNTERKLGCKGKGKLTIDQ